MERKPSTPPALALVLLLVSVALSLEVGCDGAASDRGGRKLAEESPLTAKASLIRYWRRQVPSDGGLPGSVFLDKASPLDAVGLSKFAKLAEDESSLASQLPAFASEANLFYFPEAAESLEEHSEDANFENYQLENFSGYGTGHLLGTNVFQKYGDGVNTSSVSGFSQYSRDSLREDDKFSSYAEDGNVIDQSFNSYGKDADSGEGKFSNYNDESNVPGLTFTSYSDKSNGRKQDFARYSAEANAGDQSFQSYGEEGNGAANDFSAYDASSNVITSDFENYGQKGNGGEDDFSSYGMNGNSPINDFTTYSNKGNGATEKFSSYGSGGNLPENDFEGYSIAGNGDHATFDNYADGANDPTNTFNNYARGSKGDTQSFANYLNGSNFGQASFTNYGKEADGAELDFSNYLHSSHGGPASFTGYGKDSKGDTVNFQIYSSQGSNFSKYDTSAEVTFQNGSSDSPAMAANTKKVNFTKWVEPGKFFREHMLNPGTVMPMSDIHDKLPKPSFLPRVIFSKLPFSTDKIENLEKIFRASNNSRMARILADTLKECERGPSPGETKKCVGSGEDMVDFATSLLGKNITVRSTENTQGSGKNILIGNVKGINGGRITSSVSCHKQLFPSCIYYCHSVPKVRVHEVDIHDPATKKKINTGVAVCHVDTSSWSAAHGAFSALAPGPGKIEVCHWIYENDMTWATAD